MTSIKTIINSYRTQLESAGFLRRLQEANPSERVRKMRPSLRKVTTALQEDPELLRRNVQLSPMSLLFDVTLPRLEGFLMELGEKRAEEIVSALVEHGKKVIEEHGVEGAREHLEKLYKDLKDYEERLRKDGGIEEIIEAYRRLDFEGRVEDYLRFWIGDKIHRTWVNELGMISLQMRNSTEDEDLVYLRRIGNLQELVLWSHISDAGLEHLKGLVNLRKLDLRETRISDAGLEHLKGLVNLRELYLWETKIGDAGLERIKGLVNLRELRLGLTHISDAGLKHLKVLINLRKLDLRETRISDAGLEQLKDLVNLRELYLWETKIGDTGLKHLKYLVNLQKLDLMGTQISDAGLEHLKGLVNLQELDLRKTRISDAGVEGLKRAIPGLKIIK